MRSLANLRLVLNLQCLLWENLFATGRLRLPLSVEIVPAGVPEILFGDSFSRIG